MKIHGDQTRTKCPICDQTDIRGLWEIPFARIDEPVVISGARTNMMPILDAGSTIYRYSLCNPCGSIFLGQYGSAVGNYTESTYHVEKIMNQPWTGYENRYRDWVQPHVRPTDRVLLDAGCGAGHYLFIAQRSGHPWDRLIGAELSQASVDYINQNSDDTIEAHVRNAAVEGGLDDLGLDGAVDMVILSEVFEHVDEPRVTMANLARVLKPGGRIFFTAQSTEGRLPVRPGEPIYASQAGLEQLLQETMPGYKVIIWKEGAGRWKVVLEK